MEHFNFFCFFDMSKLIIAQKSISLPRPQEEEIDFFAPLGAGVNEKINL